MVWGVDLRAPIGSIIYSRGTGHRGTSPVRKHPAPKDPPRILGTGLR